MPSLQSCRQGSDAWPKTLTRFINWCFGVGLGVSVAIWVYWFSRLLPIEMALYYEELAVTALGHPEMVSKWQKEGRLPVSLRSNEEAFRYFAARSLEYDRGVHTNIFLHLAFLAALRKNEADAEFFYTLFCANRPCDVRYSDWRRGVETSREGHNDPSVEKLKEGGRDVDGKAP